MARKKEKNVTYENSFQQVPNLVIMREPKPNYFSTFPLSGIWGCQLRFISGNTMQEADKTPYDTFLRVLCDRSALKTKQQQTTLWGKWALVPELRRVFHSVMNSNRQFQPATLSQTSPRKQTQLLEKSGRRERVTEDTSGRCVCEGASARRREMPSCASLWERERWPAVTTVRSQCPCFARAPERSLQGVHSLLCAFPLIRQCLVNGENLAFNLQLILKTLRKHSPDSGVGLRTG